MSEQIFLGGFEPENHAECQFLRDLYPAMVEKVASLSAPCELLEVYPAKEYTAVRFDSMVAFRLRFRGKSHRISLPRSLAHLIPAQCSVKDLKSDPQFVQVLLDPSAPPQEYEPLLLAVLGETVNRHPADWDCCSRYRECSDARSCVHPDKHFAYHCGYRKILSTGKIYYGKNRNVT